MSNLASQRCLRALAFTFVSNELDKMGSLRLWKGFIMICQVVVVSMQSQSVTLPGQAHLDHEFPDVKEEVANAIVVLVLVKDEKFEI
jgi:hypothetical protein